MRCSVGLVGVPAVLVAKEGGRAGLDTVHPDGWHES